MGGNYMTRKIIPYDPRLKEYARYLRRNATLAEVLLWKALKGNKLGFDFDRQRPIGRYIVDLYCKELELAIEIDGRSHDDKVDADRQRQQALELTGIRFLRFWDHEIKTDIGSVVRRIGEWSTTITFSSDDNYNYPSC